MVVKFRHGDVMFRSGVWSVRRCVLKLSCEGLECGHEVLRLRLKVLKCGLEVVQLSLEVL